jgi:cytochrome c biogenesis protein CcmG/thiol:disulfide interchange protein DsbE
MALARDGSVPIHGLNYKDQPKDAAAWLDALAGW